MTTNDDKSSNGAAKPQLSAEVEKFRAYFNMPIAVQLREPIVAVEVTQQKMERDDGIYAVAVETDGIGWPDLSLKRNDKGEPLKTREGTTVPELEAVLFGALSAGPCGTRLVLRRRTPMGAFTEVSLSPASIVYVTKIVTLPEPMKLNEGRLVQA